MLGKIFNNKEEKVSVNRNVKQDKKVILMGNLQLKKGCKIFEYDLETGAIQVAKMNSVHQVAESGDPSFRGKIVTRKNCIYIQALNEKNAIRNIKNKFGV